METTLYGDAQIRRMPGASRAARAVARLMRTLVHWHEVARQRRALLGLDQRLLDDIGASRTEALREGRRPFWEEGGRPEAKLKMAGAPDQLTWQRRDRT